MYFRVEIFGNYLSLFFFLKHKITLDRVSTKHITKIIYFYLRL